MRFWDVGRLPSKLAIQRFGLLLEFLDPHRKLPFGRIGARIEHQRAAAPGELAKKCWVHTFRLSLQSELKGSSGNRRG